MQNDSDLHIRPLHAVHSLPTQVQLYAQTSTFGKARRLRDASLELPRKEHHDSCSRVAANQPARGTPRRHYRLTHLDDAVRVAA